jgi:hypothetical protein
LLPIRTVARSTQVEGRDSMSSRDGQVAAGRRNGALKLCAALAVFALVGASCGSDDEPAGADEATSEATSDAVSEAVDDATDAVDSSEAADAMDDAEQFADDQAAALEEQQQQQGGGSATLTVGDQEWTFAPVLCAFGEEEIGQEGAEFVLSSIQDGMQMYATIDSFGHSISLDDIQDFENPSVSLSSVGDGFINVDGKSVSADADFVDNTGDGITPTAGTFEATCP